MHLFFYGDFSSCFGLPLLQVLDIAKEVASGMSHLALHKLVHRDLAARNVLLDASVVCVIADFGLSRSAQAMDDNDSAYVPRHRSRSVCAVHACSLCAVCYCARETHLTSIVLCVSTLAQARVSLAATTLLTMGCILALL